MCVFFLILRDCLWQKHSNNQETQDTHERGGMMVVLGPFFMKKTIMNLEKKKRPWKSVVVSWNTNKTSCSFTYADFLVPLARPLLDWLHFISRHNSEMKIFGGKSWTCLFIFHGLETKPFWTHTLLTPKMTGSFQKIILLDSLTLVRLDRENNPIVFMCVPGSYTDKTNVIIQSHTVRKCERAKRVFQNKSTGTLREWLAHDRPQAIKWKRVTKMYSKIINGIWCFTLKGN